MASENFLPPFRLPETQTGKGNKLQCIKRDKAVPATPEERVRQRILNWLVKEKGWDKSKIELENSYEWVGDPERHRIRPDIELFDNEGSNRGSPLVVVECKAPSIQLGGAVEQQAREYAVKSGAKHIWISNGDTHKFWIKVSRGTWDPINQLEPLQAEFDPPKVNFQFPNLDDPESVRKYFDASFVTWIGDEEYTFLHPNYRRLVLSIHKLLFHMPKRLPYSFHGVRVLEDSGSDYRQFGNAGGGRYQNLYADFIAATSGRVEALSVTVNASRRESGAAHLCVGVRKSGRNHHAVEMHLKGCHWCEESQCWRVYHDGKMSHVRSEIVFEAVKESGAGDWLEESPEGKKRLYLGKLHPAEAATWENSRELLANLLHYGLIRSNLRDAISARSRRQSK